MTEQPVSVYTRIDGWLGAWQGFGHQLPSGRWSVRVTHGGRTFDMTIEPEFVTPTDTQWR